MTPRQRFAETMRLGRPDRVPLLAEGLRDEVLTAWRDQGLPADADLDAMFGYDRRERVEIDLGPRPEIETYPTSRPGLKAFARHFDPADPARLPADWPDKARAWARREHLLELPIHSGLFLSMGVNDWRRLEELLYQIADAPDLVHEMMVIRGEFLAAMAERVLADVQVDFASFSEPIAGSNGPVVSPRTYARVVLPSYRPILDALRAGGVETVVLVTYANPRPLLPAVVEAGFDCLWACEADPAAMDYRDIRRTFGRRLRLIGGIDLDAVRAGSDAIDREIRTKVPPLLAEGGYIPLADGRVRADIPFAHYAHYRRVLQDITAG